MRSTRARSRFAVVAATVPLIAAAGPLVAPASAATATVAVYSNNIGESNTVGPNAGFRNTSQGVRGNTAVFKVDTAANAAINGVELRLSGYPTGPAIVPDRDFAPGDGFAVYKDVSGTSASLGGPDGAFGEIDFTQTPVSTGYVIGSPSGGQIPIRIAVDGVRATGSTGYFVTVHPGSSAGTIENRDFKLAVPANGIRFSDSTTSPAAAVETQKLTIDSKPPVDPKSTSFAPINRPPMERQTGTPKEDAYAVGASEHNDPDKTLLFLNDGNNVTEANFLKRPDGSPAMFTLPALPGATQELFIGDGTGITATSKTARNGQVSDDVFVRAFDRLGNLTAAVRLFDNRNGSGDKVDRSNDVTAPTTTNGAIDLHDGSAAHRGINAANVTQAPARVAFSGQATSAGGHNSVSTTEARFVVTAGGALSTAPGDATAWTPVASDNTSPDVVRVDTTGVGTTGSLMTIQGRLLDPFGNTTDSWNSASTYTKDTIPPRLASVSFLSDGGNDGVGAAGDVVQVTFSEKMYKDSISETGDSNTCALAAACVNERLTFPDGGISWGSNPTVTWSADLTSLTIELGPTTEPTPPSGSKRLPKVNDKVRMEPAVQDAVGNSATDPTLSDRFIGAIPPKPASSAVTTGDVAGRNLYNQGRDGYLDRMTVTFPFAIEDYQTKVAENLANFKIMGSDVQTPTAVTVTSNTTFTLTFGGVMLTSEQPRLVYTRPATGGLKAGGVDVPDFTVTATDKAAPAVQMVTTSDSDADGQLDTVVAKYSEAIYRSALDGEADGSYRVNGYENHPSGCLLTDEENTASEGDTPNVTLIGLCVGDVPDTAATPTTATINDYRPADPKVGSNPLSQTQNVSGTGWGTGANDTPFVFNRVLDKAPPVVVSRTTKDLNSDGRIDAIDIVYGEALNGFSVETARFTVSNRTITSIDLLGSTGVRLNLAPIAPGVVGDTDSTPTVQYHGGTDNVGLTDASDQRNAVRIDAAAQPTTDGAGPAITGACAGTAANNGSCPLDTTAEDKIKVFFSEAVDGLAVGEILVEQPAGTNKAVTAVTTATDGKSADLTLAEKAIDATKDALVRFSAANVVDDRSAGNVGNSQTASVLAPAAPTVKLDLSCPVSNSTTFCGATKVNTGAVATTGLVRYWRLSTTAPTATTPAGEYTADYPSVYPQGNTTLPEGSLTLYLSGKDDYGRTAGVTPTVSDTITILRAPEIGTVSLVNTTRPATGTWGRTDTVVDGDNLNVKAVGYSNDADQWAPNGVCSSARMSIDYRGITANKSLGAVAPFSCDLSTTTFRKSRTMTFPFVKVVGTTRYPVGTVLKQSANDPGWLIVDGANGTLARRQFVSVNARRSWQITDSSVITVPVSVLNGYPRLTRVGFRDGAVIKTSGSGYYYVYDSIKRPISSGQLAAWKMPLSQVYNVSSGELNAHPTGAGFAYGAHALGTWVRFPDGSVNQITKNRLGQVVRRGVTSSWALRTLVPGAQIYSANSYDRAVPYDTTFMRGYRDGVMVKVNSTTYGVVSRTVLRTFANPTTFNTMGFNTSNAWPYSPSYLPRTATGFTTGAAIDRYKITSVVVKVTNLAGDSASKIVLPGTGGIWGVGTLDPIPANWDASRK
ncbi:MAG TPA: hypothetical protein VGX28_11125 [Frankiaceae bacterium]|jgi:hypothetical protein|nr:hypothetical protein [Frankiaceae bacterium]